MSQNLKVVLYNWAPFLDRGKRGGGVSIYQNNIVEAFCKRGIETVVVSSGLSYTLYPGKVHFKLTKKKDGYKEYEIINSPIPAPAYLSSGEPNLTSDDLETKDVFREIMEMEAPIAAVHFNNLEGISRRVFELKEEYQSTRFIFSMHNYYVFCPQVNLWQYEERNCLFNNFGRHCVVCNKKMFKVSDLIKTKKFTSILSPLARMGVISFKREAQVAYFFSAIILPCIKRIISTISSREEKLKLSTESKSREYLNFIKGNVEYLNKYMDTILCVSERTAKISVDHGLESNKIVTEYIGTKFSGLIRVKDNACDEQSVERLTIAYFGYERRDKGFHFFLDCLDKMSEYESKEIGVMLAVRVKEKKNIEKVESISGKFRDFNWYNGYTHDELNSLLGKVDLGVVPVLWEDNLPQISFEFVSHGVPILTSNLGGAQEVSGNANFIFKAGDCEDFLLKLKRILENYNSLKSQFFENIMDLPTVDEHVKKLAGYYNS